MSGRLSPLEREVSHWLARCDRGLSDAEHREFEAWLAGDSRRRTMLAAMRRSWKDLDALRGSAQAAALDGEVSAYRLRRQRRALRWRAVPGWLAAAACLGIAVSLLWRNRDPHPAGPASITLLATELGEVLETRLPDGSRVKLNTQTKLEVDFQAGERRLHLVRGEAFFVVAKDPARPFVVTAGAVDVRAIGTEFNVRRYADALEVLVREGRVRVDRVETRAASLAAADSGPTVLDAGQKVRIALVASDVVAERAAVIAVPDLEVDRSLAWQEGKLIFTSSPLREVVAEFNRRTTIPLVVADAALAERHFGGTFVANNPETLLELLASTYGVTVERRPDMIVLRMKR